ncbi:hypothetical protein EFW57_03511 [Bacillus velezensis]|nr:hypothetical protein EFW57_03511 [Bacillus velezensis]RUS03306.1 hypothetical protein EFW58_03754 [Bacillus velezensis]
MLLSIISTFIFLLHLPFKVLKKKMETTKQTECTSKKESFDSVF